MSCDVECKHNQSQSGLVLPIGGFAEQDACGYIVNTASVHKIVSPWTGALSDIQTMHREYFSDRFHSLYCRGSVAQGTAIQGVADREG